MKNDDSFGVELDLNINKFKNKIKEATTVSTEFAKKIEKTRHFGQNAFGDIVELKEFSDEIANQNRLYSEQQKILSSISKLNRNKSALSNLGTTNLMEGNNYSGFIASFKKATVEEKKEINNLNNEIEKTGDITKRTGNEISNAFTKGLKSVKKLTIGFLGARTTFGLFRRYMNEYASENEVFAQKMQLTTSVIANALAPAFEFFGNVIQYVVIGLAKVIELLFGVNILGRTVDNSLKGASKSAKELNDNLSGLDEISNIDKQAGGLDTGISSQLSALNDFQEKIKEVEELFNKWGVDEKLKKIKELFISIWDSQVMQWIRDLLKDIIDWSIKHPNVVATILGGTALIKLIKNIMGVSGGTGLLGLVGNLETLKAMGIIGITISIGFLAKQKFDNWLEEEKEKISNKLDDIDEKLKQNREQIYKDIESGNKKAIRNYYDTISENYSKTMSNLADVYDKANNPLFRFWEEKNYGKEGLEEYDNDLKRLQDDTKELYLQSKLMYESDLLNDEEIEKFKDLIGSQIDFAREIGYTKDEVNELIDEYMEINTSEESLQRMTDKMKDLGYTEDEITEKLTPFFLRLKYGLVDSSGRVNDMKNDLVSMFEKTYQIKINISAAVNTLNAAGSIASQALKNLNLKVPSYDIGTDYVPRDQLAMIHEGERIIPKQYNNSNYLGGLGNSETNSLLMELNRNVLELANRPSILSVNGKELAKATYSDFQEENSRRGSNMSVRRV